MPAPVPKPSDASSNDIAAAVRDTVTVRGQTEYATRNRVARSQPPSAPKSPQRRAQSQDPSEKSMAKPVKSKKGSQHADVIDRLDFTGVGPMFHHDGPFDACAPSRNRQRNKAPMHAWTPDEILASDTGAYPSAEAFKAFSNTTYVDPPKKKVDAIAEAWGIHEPEPYEEFFAGGGTGRGDSDTPASSIYNGRDTHSKVQRRSKDPKESRDVYRDYLESPPQAILAESSGRQVKRSVPPPQPIFVPDNADVSDTSGQSPPLSPGGNPQRKKSLIHRIRELRDAPNVPIPNVTRTTIDQPPSPPSKPESQRPTHRSQNSFLGRFSGSRSGQLASDKSEPFVYIEQSNKELPPPPVESGSPPEPGYFDSANGGMPGSPGNLGRKTSLMKKVGRVVGRNRQ
ncbi:hypothetical protein H0H93_015192 [Arthromyces matolae]|nr:hypothetical protein H0H93_015192 [Arthromyces matolae]